MSNIARYNPVSELTTTDTFDDPFDDLYRGFFMRPINWGLRALESQTGFRVDVVENDNEYRVQAEIPGVRKEDIQITINGDRVAISAEVKREKDVKNDDGNVIYAEREYGDLYRAFTLGKEVDETRAQAKYTDGVLVLTLPKSDAASATRKRIPVH